MNVGDIYVSKMVSSFEVRHIFVDEGVTFIVTRKVDSNVYGVQTEKQFKQRLEDMKFTLKEKK